MDIETDILIIGGGISGFLTARELCLAKKHVTILDKSVLAQESSWAGGGILLPIYPWRQATAISELVNLSLKMYPELSKELINQTGIDPEWRDCGMLICKNPDIKSAQDWCKQYQIPFETALPKQNEILETEFLAPLWLPGIAQIRNPRLLKAMRKFLEQIGVNFIENANITEIANEQGQLKWLATSSQRIHFKQLIICAGAWTDYILQSFFKNSISLPIEPIKGQMLVFDAKPETLEYMVLDADSYLIPRRDGKILAGSTLESVGFDKSTTISAKEKLYSFATTLLPSLKNCPVSYHWAGLRPGSPDGIPYIGKHPAFDNLSINAGHFRNGLVMGPAAALLLADLLLDRPACIDPSPYRINR